MNFLTHVIFTRVQPQIVPSLVPKPRALFLNQNLNGPYSRIHKTVTIPDGKWQQYEGPPMGF